MTSSFSKNRGPQIGAAKRAVDETKGSKSLSQTFQLGDFILFGIAHTALEVHSLEATLKSTDWLKVTPR